jgi:hypothetical protein
VSADRDDPVVRGSDQARTKVARGLGSFVVRVVIGGPRDGDDLELSAAGE